MYCDTVSHSILLLNQAMLFTAKNGEESLKKIGELCKKQFPRSEIHTFIFLKKPFLVHQIIANMGKMVLVSLFFNNEDCHPFGVHFLLPYATFSEQMKIVESVAGSIKVAVDKKAQ